MGFLVGDCSPPADNGRESRAPLLLVVETTQTLSRAVGFFCKYLGVRVEAVGMHQDLRVLLAMRGPIAVMAPADAADHDTGRLLEIVAEHDRDLPVLLVIGRDCARLGRIEGAEAILGLTAVQKMTAIPGIGDLTDFLLKAGKRRVRRSFG